MCIFVEKFTTMQKYKNKGNRGLFDQEMTCE